MSIYLNIELISCRQFWLITAARTSAQFWWVWYLGGRRSVPLGGLSSNFLGSSFSCGKRQCLAGGHLGQLLMWQLQSQVT